MGKRWRVSFLCPQSGAIETTDTNTKASASMITDFSSIKHFIIFLFLFLLIESIVFMTNLSSQI